MPGKRIVVEDGLTPFREHLAAQGYEVVADRDHPLSQADAVVIRGMDENLAGITTRTTKAIVVNAEGKSPEDVARELKQRLR